jgi:hypothetical protein
MMMRNERERGPEGQHDAKRRDPLGDRLHTLRSNTFSNLQQTGG